VPQPTPLCPGFLLPLTVHLAAPGMNSSPSPSLLKDLSEFISSTLRLVLPLLVLRAQPEAIYPYSPSFAPHSYFLSCLLSSILRSVFPSVSSLLLKCVSAVPHLCFIEVVLFLRGTHLDFVPLCAQFLIPETLSFGSPSTPVSFFFLLVFLSACSRPHFRATPTRASRRSHERSPLLMDPGPLLTSTHFYLSRTIFFPQLLNKRR